MATKQELLNQQLENLTKTSREIKGATLITPDGMIIASAFAGDRQLTDTAAAMGATILGLGASVSKTLGAGLMEEIIIRGQNDFIVVLTLPPKAALLVQADNEVALGFLLLKARQCMKALATLL